MPFTIGYLRALLARISSGGGSGSSSFSFPLLYMGY